MTVVRILDIASDWFAGLSYFIILAWLQWAIVLRPLINFALGETI